MLTTEPMNALLQDLEEAQYTDLYHVDDAPIADLRLTAMRRLGWWAVVLVLIGLVLGFVIVLPDTIPTPFVFKSERAEEIYRFPSTVYIERMYVRNGQHIKPGDTILEISAPDIAALARELSSAESNLSSFRNFRTASATDEQAITKLTIHKTQEEIGLKETQVAIADRKWESESGSLLYHVTESKRLLATNRTLYQSGDISKNDLNDLELKQFQSQSAYDLAYQNHLENRTSLNRQIASKKLEISILEKQIAKNASDLLLEGDHLHTALTATRKRIEGTYGAFSITANAHLLLKATRSSTVSFVFEGEKEAVAGTTLLKMMYDEAPLYAHTQVNSSQIGKIRAGQSVILKVDAYPVYEWGSVTGEVNTVSLTPDEKGLFNVRLRITNEQNLHNLLRIGMQGKADIITDERTMYGHLFRKFKKTASAFVD
jgi:multidrug efflux pump subunit AcrA (membrane-fusion protein)